MKEKRKRGGEGEILYKKGKTFNGRALASELLDHESMV